MKCNGFVHLVPAASARRSPETVETSRCDVPARMQRSQRIQLGPNIGTDLGLKPLQSDAEDPTVARASASNLEAGFLVMIFITPASAFWPKCDL